MKNFNINTCKKLDFNSIPIEQLEILVEPWQLAILLLLEPETDATDILLENMLSYYVEEEKYEYCIIIRDEIERRNPLY